ncbi:hypothetical protein EB061_13610, partial [bacterium]|nr:hypothetical protein [bacterium]
RKALARHIVKTCPKLSMVCAECKETILRENSDRHSAEECSERQIGCEYCGTRVKWADLLEHWRSVCPDKELPCTNACGAPVKRVLMDDHLTNECPKRVIQCIMNCGQTLRAEDEKAHLESVCEKRLVACKYCLEGVQAHILDAHTATCTTIEITCSTCRTRGTKAKLTADGHMGFRGPDKDICRNRALDYIRAQLDAAQRLFQQVGGSGIVADEIAALRDKISDVQHPHESS